NSLDDRFAPGDRDDRAGTADAGLLDALLDGVGDDLGLPDRALRDDLAREGHARKRFQGEPPLALGQLDELDRAGANVEPERRRLLTESKQRHIRLPAFS